MNLDSNFLSSLDKEFCQISIGNLLTSEVPITDNAINQTQPQ